MDNRKNRTKGPWRLASFLVLLVATLNAYAEPPRIMCPGRSEDSREPWGAFLGKAAHIAIAEEYRRTHPENTVFSNTVCLSTIVKNGNLGDASRVPEFTSCLCPDITDTDALVLFEIKPDDKDLLNQGRLQAARYLAALNAVVEPDKKLTGGMGLEGRVLVEFEDGQFTWELSWRTPEPGVTLYRWVSKRRRPKAPLKELETQREEELPKEKIQELGELVEQAISAAYGGGQRPAGFKGQIYVAADCQ